LDPKIVTKNGQERKLLKVFKWHPLYISSSQKKGQKVGTKFTREVAAPFPA
jgi:hypothetical protein